MFFDVFWMVILLIGFGIIICCIFIIVVIVEKLNKSEMVYSVCY